MDSAEFAVTCQRFGLTTDTNSDGDPRAFEPCEGYADQLRIVYRAARAPSLPYVVYTDGPVLRVRTLGEALAAAFPPSERVESPAPRWLLTVERTVAPDLSGFKYAVYLYRGGSLRLTLRSDAVQPFAAAFYDGEMPVEVLAGWVADHT